MTTNTLIKDRLTILLMLSVYRYRATSSVSKKRLKEIVQMCLDSLHCLLDSGCDVNYYRKPEHFTRLRATALLAATQYLDEEVTQW